MKGKRLGAYQPLVDAAIAAGWTLETTGGNHRALVPPEPVIDPYTGRPVKRVVFPFSPSDTRGVRNTTALLRRLGVDVPR